MAIRAPDGANNNNDNNNNNENNKINNKNKNNIINNKFNTIKPIFITTRKKFNPAGGARTRLKRLQQKMLRLALMLT